MLKTLNRLIWLGFIIGGTAYAGHWAYQATRQDPALARVVWGWLISNTDPVPPAAPSEPPAPVRSPAPLTPQTLSIPVTITTQDPGQKGLLNFSAGPLSFKVGDRPQQTTLLNGTATITIRFSQEGDRPLALPPEIAIASDAPLEVQQQMQQQACPSARQFQSAIAQSLQIEAREGSCESSR